jgi:hypothetical protein
MIGSLPCIMDGFLVCSSGTYVDSLSRHSGLLFSLSCIGCTCCSLLCFARSVARKRIIRCNHLFMKLNPAQITEMTCDKERFLSGLRTVRDSNDNNYLTMLVTEERN